MNPNTAPREFLQQLQEKLRRSIGESAQLLADLDGWNSQRVDAPPITADDYPQFLETAADLRLMRAQLTEVEYQLDTGNYGPLPT